MRNVKMPWLSSGVLILANLAQLLGVFFFNWNFFSVFLLYWLESFIVVFFIILKARVVRKQGNATTKVGDDLWGAVYIFCYISVIFGYLTLTLFPKGMSFANILWAILFLFISHWISYVVNFLGQQEFKTISLQQLMQVVFKRLLGYVSVFTFCTIYILFFRYDERPSEITKDPLVLMIIIKIILDLSFHIDEHMSKPLDKTDTSSLWPNRESVSGSR